MLLWRVDWQLKKINTTYLTLQSDCIYTFTFLFRLIPVKFPIEIQNVGALKINYKIEIEEKDKDK